MDEDELAARFRNVDRATLETLASGLTSYGGSANLDPKEVGMARAELAHRKRVDAEEREKSRREFDMQMFNVEGERQAKRQQFESGLAQRQMDHADGLAKEQLSTAQSAAKAARWAAAATAVAALGAIAQAAIAILK